MELLINFTVQMARDGTSTSKIFPFLIFHISQGHGYQMHLAILSQVFANVTAKLQ
jgi:hypothetical protein